MHLVVILMALITRPVHRSSGLTTNRLRMRVTSIPEHSRARQESVALRLVLEAVLEEAAAHGLDLYSWVELHWNSVAAVSQPSSATLQPYL